MPNLTAVLNNQIRRFARKEVTAESRAVRKLTAQHRRDIAELKRQLAALQKAVSFLEKQETRRVTTPKTAAASEAEGLRFRADGLQSHRKRLGLSAADYGRLVGVSGQSIYMWESGRSRPRRQQVAKLATLRGLGKREAERRLALLGTSEG